MGGGVPRCVGRGPEGARVRGAGPLPWGVLLCVLLTSSAITLALSVACFCAYLDRLVTWPVGETSVPQPQAFWAEPFQRPRDRQGQSVGEGLSAVPQAACPLGARLPAWHPRLPQRAGGWALRRPPPSSCKGQKWDLLELFPFAPRQVRSLSKRK